MRTVLRHPRSGPCVQRPVLTLPAETYIAEQLAVADPQRIHAVREAMREVTGPGPVRRLAVGL